MRDSLSAYYYGFTSEAGTYCVTFTVSICVAVKAENKAAAVRFVLEADSEALAEMDREPGISDRKITEVIRAQ